MHHQSAAEVFVMCTFWGSHPGVRACVRVRATRSSSLPFPLILFFTTECAATNILRALCTDVCPCLCKWCLSSSFVKFTSQEGVYKTKRFGSCTTTSVVRCFGTEWLLYSWPVTGEFHKRWWQQVAIPSHPGQYRKVMSVMASHKLQRSRVWYLSINVISFWICPNCNPSIQLTQRCFWAEYVA